MISRGSRPWLVRRRGDGQAEERGMYFLSLRVAHFSKVFQGLSFNFWVPVEDEVGESDSDGEDSLGVSSTAHSSTLLPGDPVVESAQAPTSDT